MRDALEAFAERFKERALEQWRFESLRWAMLAPWMKHPTEPPKVPEILKRD